MTCGGGTRSRSRTGGKSMGLSERTFETMINHVFFFVADPRISEDPSINGPIHQYQDQTDQET